MTYTIVLYRGDEIVRPAYNQPFDRTNRAEAEEIVKILNTKTVLATGYEYRIEEK